MCINNSNIDNSTVINDHAPILIFHNVQRQATRCESCKLNLKQGNKISKCEGCSSSFHPKCHTEVKFDSHSCSLCLLQNLPFYKYECQQYQDDANRIQ